jgi:hypothetical protein
MPILVLSHCACNANLTLLRIMVQLCSSLVTGIDIIVLNLLGFLTFCFWKVKV